MFRGANHLTVTSLGAEGGGLAEIVGTSSIRLEEGGLVIRRGSVGTPFCGRHEGRSSRPRHGTGEQMKLRKSEIQAVVEVVIDTKEMWVPLPPEPWPRFVRLSGSTSPEEVALVVGVLSSYGRADQEPAATAGSLCADFPGVLPGGLAVVSSDREIWPGCCSGLERWREWIEFLVDGQSPWTGHDPAPLVEVAGDEVHVWSDGGLLGDKPDEIPVIFHRDAFAEALAQAGSDLEAFLAPLRAWLDTHAPSDAKEIARCFAKVFLGQDRQPDVE